MVLRRSGIATVLLGGILAVLHFAPGYVTSRLVNADTVPFPGVNTTAEAIVVSQVALDAGAFVVGTAGVFLVGYWAGVQVDLRHNYREMLVRFGLSGLLGYTIVVATLLVYAALLTGGPFHDQPHRGSLTAILIAGRAVGIAVQFALLGSAGAAAATFTADT